MKRKIICAFLALTMAMSSFGVTSFARYTSDTNTYEYKSTTDLEATIDNEKVVITWPAVDTTGKIINANPLKADGQSSSTGNPTAGWTNPTQGMIIQYNGWLPDGTHNSVKNDNKTNHNVLYGLTDKKTDYPVAVLDPKDNSFVKNAYVDTTVVATSFATAYEVQYSEDGINWKQDHIASSFNHGKKLTRINADGTYSNDKKNTFFLEDQITEALTASLKPETKYFIRVNAYDASNSASLSTPYKTFETTITTPKAKELTPAFPTVEGSGIYSQGGRGSATQKADVYVVTNLTDSVSNPEPGSLRYGLERRDRTDGNKNYPRIITFAVDGVINVDPTASKSQRRLNISSNTTVLGQTAPGEGITVYGASIKFNGENIISRYLRFRLGEGYDQDAATATGSNIVVDHCTFSWGVDECFTAKEIINSSIQYNIIASSMSFPNKTGVNNTDPEIASGESEAKHGMGSILNGSDVSYTHNLWANHGTRNPRFEGGFTYNGVSYGNKIDFANNVIYNWGHNSGYGGERGKGNTNIVGNYYKPGPNTLEKAYTRIFDIDGSTSKYFFKDNVMTSSDEVTANNKLGFYDVTDSAVLSTPVELTNPYTATSANDAYSKVIDSVGASYKRDAQDARLINELKNGTGRFVNNEFEAGGILVNDGATAPKDTDFDGIPDEWETSHGLNPNDSSDATAIVTDETKSYNGYTNIEVYANDLLGEWKESTITLTTPENPVPTINSISGDTLVNNSDVNYTLTKGQTYTINKSVTSAVNSYKILLNDKVVAENTDTFTVPSDENTGMYYLALFVTSDKGDAISSAIPVTVIDSANNSNLEGFTSTDIGAVKASGGDYYDSTSNTLVSTGAGHIGILNTSSTQAPDAFHFNYKEISGNFTFTAKVDNLAKLDYMQQSGLMVRKSLDPTSEFYMASLTYIKGEDYEGIKDITGDSVKAKNIRTMVRTADGSSIGYTNNMLGIPVVRVNAEPNKGWARISRSGNTITLSASLDGSNWYTMDTYETTLPNTVYVGFATDAAQDTMSLVKYNGTVFSNIELSNGNGGKGDANCDGKIDITDVQRVLNYVLSPETTNMTSEEIENSKVTGNDNVTTMDVAEILQKVLDSSYQFNTK